MAKRSKLSIIKKHLAKGYSVYINQYGFIVSYLKQYAFVIPFNVKKEHIQTFIQKHT